jgi:hypothetical protein
MTIYPLFLIILISVHCHGTHDSKKYASLFCFGNSYTVLVIMWFWASQLIQRVRLTNCLMARPFFTTQLVAPLMVDWLWISYVLPVDEFMKTCRSFVVHDWLAIYVHICSHHRRIFLCLCSLNIKFMINVCCFCWKAK